MDKLGIYIPTYNRKRDLELCMRSFIPQLKRYGFPIYVSDNNSTDGTEKVVNKLKRSYSKIFYKKNDTGLGPTYASNLVSVINMGKTEFAWLFGDDDVIKAGAIDRIVTNLPGHDYLQINTEIWNRDFSKKFQGRKIQAKRNIDYAPGDHDDVLANASYGYAGFMGEIITRTSYLKNGLKKLKGPDLAAREFLHTTLFFNSIIGREGRLIAEPLVKYRTTLRFGGKEMYTWLVSFPKTLEELGNSYSEETLRSVGSLPVYSLIGITAINRLQNPGNARAYMKYVREDRMLDSSTKAILLTILTVPKPIVRAVIYPTVKINAFEIL
ncbi:MAG: glycosyltransferase family 2 protein [Candidatus Micrarchaeota archaeon]|nr:glycosyltransferase family 2 protein [Candidatus Micrarchaeota archaeon]